MVLFVINPLGHRVGRTTLKYLGSDVLLVVGKAMRGVLLGWALRLGCGIGVWVPVLGFGFQLWTTVEVMVVIFDRFWYNGEVGVVVGRAMEMGRCGKRGIRMRVGGCDLVWFGLCQLDISL